MQEFAAQRAKAQTPEENTELLGTLDALNERMGQVAEEAQSVTQVADEQDFTDVGRQADSLRMQLLSARNKLVLLRKGLAPS
jgi:hypothetical protein